MRLTRGSDYGVRGMIYLARQPIDKISLIEEIAANEDIPDNYLAKIFQNLAKNGLVRSQRGPRGGFALARPAEEITLRETIEAIQGPLVLSECLDSRRGCKVDTRCSLQRALARGAKKPVSGPGWRHAA